MATLFLAGSQQFKKKITKGCFARKYQRGQEDFFQFFSKSTVKRRGEREESEGGAVQGRPCVTLHPRHSENRLLVSSRDGLCFSDEPLESFLAALLLQLLPDHVPAGLVVVVEPVALFVCKLLHINHLGLYWNQC